MKNEQFPDLLKDIAIYRKYYQPVLILPNRFGERI